MNLENVKKQIEELIEDSNYWFKQELKHACLTENNYQNRDHDSLENASWQDGRMLALKEVLKMLEEDRNFYKNN